jgi:hypothetical protein
MWTNTTLAWILTTVERGPIMSDTLTTSIEPGNRVQLPAEWAEALGLRETVRLERTTEGILIRPCPRLTWDEVFASRLQINSAPPDPNPDEVEVTGDDFLF